MVALAPTRKKASWPEYVGRHLLARPDSGADDHRTQCFEKPRPLLPCFARNSLTRLQPRINGFALQRQDAKYAFVDLPKGLPLNEAVKPLDAERKLTKSQ